MITRRKFIQSAIAGMSTTAMTGLLPTSVLAAVADPLSSTTWTPLSDGAVWTAAWNLKFKNQLPHALLLQLVAPVAAAAGAPALPGVNFTYQPDSGVRGLGGEIYTIGAGETTWSVLGPGLKQTKVWGYANREFGVTFPSRSIEVRRGKPITVKWQNNLFDANGPLPSLLPVDQTIMEGVLDVAKAPVTTGVPIAIHHHGGDTAAEFDGGPDQWMTPKRVQVGPGIKDCAVDAMTGAVAPAGTGNCNADAAGLTYVYDNNQEASLHWYHDHGEGVTRTNAYAGLAGLYVVRDANEDALTDLTGAAAGSIVKHKIPSGQYELPLVIQDRVFIDDGQYFSMAYGADAGQYPVPLATINPDLRPTIQLQTDLNPPHVDATGATATATVATVDANGKPGSYQYNPAAPTHYPEMFGDIITVNGVAWPNCNVEPREYRLRLLNGSDSRVYTLSFGGLPFWQIATELGFLNNPVPMKTITIAPGERQDIVVDFANAPTRKVGGTKARTVVVRNSAPTPFPLGAPVMANTGPDVIMQFTVGALTTAPRTRIDSSTPLRGRANPLTTPAALRTLPLAPAVVPLNTRVRRILLGEGADQYGRVTPLLGGYDPNPLTNVGTRLFADGAAEIVDLKADPLTGAIIPTTEVWEFWNGSVDSHPIHMHLVQFRVLNRQTFAPVVAANPTLESFTMRNGWSGVRLVNVAPTGRPTAAPAGEQGWKDTVLCPPGQVTRVLVSFNRPGQYVYHCHILSHEEHDMMQWYQVRVV